MHVRIEQHQIDRGQAYDRELSAAVLGQSAAHTLPQPWMNDGYTTNESVNEDVTMMVTTPGEYKVATAEIVPPAPIRSTTRMHTASAAHYTAAPPSAPTYATAAAAAASGNSQKSSAPAEIKRQN